MCFAETDIRFQHKINKESKLPISRQCELLGIKRSTYYYKPIKPDPKEQERREQLMAKIDEIHTKYPYMGQRRITEKLREADFSVGRKLVRSLMREMAIYPIYPKPNLSKRNFKQSVVPYLLRNMPIYMPNQVWSIDITYIKMLHGHMYLTAIIDWYSRKIVGWNLSDTLDTVHVIRAVEEATAKYGIPGIINSDQGAQFTSIEYKELLKSLQIRQSMDGKSRWADNVMIERWFRSLKTEKIYIEEFRTPKELRAGIRAYIREYNAERPHMAHDYATPDSIYYGMFQAEAKQDAA